ncbi:hypothetical protein F5148DRAFT_1152860 [Russula earlei]|uniref:Uncharacterized protein n=1 Tax=Russula earlei TaxID=71964 RepID=A0ACC0TV38_9AGAM|nr:hypothetical protein F5148DRAFT_1152860 [Russula earlei]
MPDLVCYKLMGSSLHSDDNIDSDTGNPDELVAFNGNAFGGPGDYVDDDFGQDALAQEPPVQEDKGDNFDEQEEELEAAQVADLETSWEPEHLGARFMTQYQNLQYTKAQVEVASHNIHIPFQKLPVYHHIKFASTDPYSINSLQTIVDSIHAQPAYLDKYGKGVPAWFDTGLITYRGNAIYGVSGG